MDSHTLGEGESHKHLVLGLIWQIIAVSYLTLTMQINSYSLSEISWSSSRNVFFQMLPDRKF